MTTQTRFETLQAQYRTADNAAKDYRGTLQGKYGSGFRSWATKTENAKLDRLQARADKVSDRMFTLLATISPRDWTQGIPAHYPLTTLTFADAVTAGPLSVVPPPAWGCTQPDSVRFAQALTR